MVEAERCTEILTRYNARFLNIEEDVYGRIWIFTDASGVFCYE